MLSFFRRALGSWVVLGLLGIVLVAFLVTGIGSPSGIAGLGGIAADPNSVATVGGEEVTAAEVSRRVQGQFADAKRQQPDLTMAQLLAASGGVSAVVDQMATGRALEVWAAKQGFTASNPLIDAQIATIPAFQGAAGQFDERVMQGTLAQQHITLAELRASIRGDLLRRQLLVPMTAGYTAAPGVARAYAGLMLARRVGEIALVPIDPSKVPAPSAVDVANWYKAHIAAYSLPERRVIRYVPINPDTVPTMAPTEAEIGSQYQADAAKYGASEQRTLSQVTLPDEKAAQAFAAKVGGGTAFAAAAKDAGFAPADIALGKLTKTAFATASSPAIADQVFAAKEGAVVGPVKSALGFQIVHVDSIEKNAAKTLAQVHGEIADALAKKKKAEALTALGQKLEDAIADGATFDDVVRKNNLKVVTTPPVIAAGTAPTDPNFKPDATLAPLMRTAFQASPEDQPTVETVGADHYALLSVASITPGAPVPFDQVRDRATMDLTADRAGKAARAIAVGIVDKLNKGQPLAPLLAAAGLKPAQSANASQMDAARLQQVPPPLRALFTLAPGHAAYVPGPGGWFIARLDRIEDADPKIADLVSGQLKQELNGTVSNELLEQFARATRATLKVEAHPAAINALGRQLTGQAPAGQ